MHIGYCLDCGRSYEAERAVDALCPECQAHEDRVYQNITTPYVETEPWPWSKAAMRERLGVTGDEDA